MSVNSYKLHIVQTNLLQAYSGHHKYVFHIHPVVNWIVLLSIVISLVPLVTKIANLSYPHPHVPIYPHEFQLYVSIDYTVCMFAGVDKSRKRTVGLQREGKDAGTEQGRVVLLWTELFFHVGTDT